MGRAKLEIKKLQNFNARQATYAKRKHGIMKKSNELSILCDIVVMLLMFSPAGKPSLFTGKHSIEEVIAKYAKLTPQERAKRRLENLEALKKTFMKLDHDVDISEFLDKGTQTVEVLSEKIKFLQTQLSDTHARVRNWTDLEKIDSEDVLRQLENSLKQSLSQIHALKASMSQYEQQQHLISSQCKNQLQNQIGMDFGIKMEQRLGNISWGYTNENMNMPLMEQKPNLPLQQVYKDMAYSASTSFGNFSAISTPNVELGTSADPNLQYTNVSFLNDPKIQQLDEWNLLGSPADYYVSQILEASYKPQFGGNNGFFL